MNVQGWFLLWLTSLIFLQRDSQESSTPWFESINSLVLSLLQGPNLTSSHHLGVLLKSPHASLGLRSLLFLISCHGACGILVPQPGIEPAPPVVEARSLEHWTSWEVPSSLPLNSLLSKFWPLSADRYHFPSSTSSTKCTERCSSVSCACCSNEI